jgi:arylformamidase
MTSHRNRTFVASILAVLAVALTSQAASAGPLRDAIMQRRAAQGQNGGLDEEADRGPATLPPGIRIVRDVAYGNDPRQHFDVYAPMQAHDAPVILLVHGGGWQRGDKAMRNVIENKVARWVPRGIIVISIDYRMLPDTPPLQQASDVGRALAFAQRQAASWGGSRDRFILMGHSAGAHLVSLISAEPSFARYQGASPWLGTVALDSAAFDVSVIMQGRHFPLYDNAFGNDQATWTAASPLQQLNARGVPFLAVCSSQRRESCPQAQRFVAKATSLGMRAQLLEQDKTHEEINKDLGMASDYTNQVEAFLRSLDPAVASALDAR